MKSENEDKLITAICEVLSKLWKLLDKAEKKLDE